MPFFSPIIAFFTGGVGRWLVLAAAIGIGVLGLRYHWMQAGRDEITLANVKAAERIVVKQGEVTERVVTKYLKVKGETKTVTETVEKEVIRYADANLDQCVLSNGFVSLHNSAAANRVPEAAKSVDGSPSGIKTAAAVDTITQNYATCNQTADRLRGLQDWVTEQGKLR